MLRNYIILAIRNLKNNLLYTILSITGIALGFALALLVMIYIIHEIGHDRHFLEHEQVYRLEPTFFVEGKEDAFALCQLPIGPVLQEEYPGIESFTRLVPLPRQFFGSNTNSYAEERFYYADSSYWEVFPTRFLHGSPDSSLREPGTIVLTQTTARKYFGVTDPMGKMLRSSDGRYHRVEGVIEDLPTNSHLRFEALLPILSLAEKIGVSRIQSREPVAFWNVMGYTYIKMHKSVSIDSLTRTFPTIHEKYAKPVGELINGSFNLHARPLADIHHCAKSLQGDLPPGNMGYALLMVATAIFVLLIACINFVNMALSMAVGRAREYSLRAALGASPGKLLAQFLVESSLISLISLLFAIISLPLLLRVFNSIVDTSLKIGFQNFGFYLPIVILAAILLGLLTGIYPARCLLVFKPVNIPRVKSGIHHRWIIPRVALVVLQLSIAVFMLAGHFMISGQLKYLENKNPGFDKTNLVVIHANDSLSRINAMHLLKQADSLPFVEGTFLATSLPGLAPGKMVTRIENEDGNHVDKALNFVEVGPGFVEVLKINIVIGRSYGGKADSRVLINESLASILGGNQEAIGKVIQTGIRQDGTATMTYRVGGIVEDFHYTSLQYPIEPLLIIPQSNPLIHSYFVARTKNGAVETLLDYFAKTRTDKLGISYLDYGTLEDYLREDYREEVKVERVFRYFTMISMFLAVIGLMGLTGYMSRQRVKELSIRRILGASIGGITFLLTRSMVRWVLWANLIAIPLAYLLMNSWVDRFAYKAPLKFWYLLFTIIISVSITAITIAWQSLQMARQDPLNAIKIE